MPSTVAIIAALAVVLMNALVMAEDDNYSARYGFDIDLPGSYAVLIAISVRVTIKTKTLMSIICERVSAKAHHKSSKNLNP